MKRAGYLLIPLLVCSYIATTMGIASHTCDAEGTIQFRLLTGASLCHHKDMGHREEVDDHEACGCNRHGDHCCHTSVYVLDNARKIVEGVRIDAPEGLDVVILWARSNNIFVLYELTLRAFHAATIVLGPDGGFASITPLRV